MLLFPWRPPNEIMVNDRFIWCRNCGAIHRVTPSDRAPVYAVRDGAAVEEAANDWRDFMAHHNGHRLEPMTATGADYYPDGFAGDPMSVRYLEVSNGSETLLLRRSRSSIEKPFCYVPVEGRLMESGACLGIQEEAIRKEMKVHFVWAPATPFDDNEIANFIGVFKELVCELDPARVHPGEYSCTDDRVAYCELDAATIDALIDRCFSRFQPNQLVSLRRFVETHRQCDNVMAVVKRRAVMIAKRTNHAPLQTDAFYRS